MKRRRIAGLLTAAVLMLTSVPFMTANAIDDRLETGTKDGYNWELWLQDDQGSAEGEQGENGTFSCEWNSSLGFLYRSGHRFEDCIDWRNTERITVDYKASEFQTNGNAAYIGLHGWTKNAVAEFYIIDGYGTWSPALFGFKIPGEVTSDDGTYEVFQREISGVTAEGRAARYKQIWSVRKGSRKEGTIDVTAHFRTWESLRLNVGDLFDISLTVEGYQSSGTAVFTQNDLKISTGAADPQPAITTPAAVTGTAPQTTAAPSVVKCGDANGDDSIDLRDVTLMRRALAGWNVTVNESAADVNKDGSFDLKDIVILRRYLAGGWGVEL